MPGKFCALDEALDFVRIQVGQEELAWLVVPFCNHWLQFLIFPIALDTVAGNAHDVFGVVGDEQITDVYFAEFFLVNFVQNTPLFKGLRCTLTDGCEHMPNIGRCQ